MKELITIQSELKAPKSQFNKFGGYKYRKAEDILEAVKPLLAKQKCTLIISDDIVMIGNRIYVKATSTIKNEKGECETTTGWAREEETKKGMDGSQITGASSSYARKYALNGLFAIDDNADSDITNTDQQDNTHHLAAQQTAQAQQQSQYHPDNLAEALEMVKRCVNRDNIKWVMGTYMSFNSNALFMQALSDKRKELGL